MDRYTRIGREPSNSGSCDGMTSDNRDVTSCNSVMGGIGRAVPKLGAWFPLKATNWGLPVGSLRQNCGRGVAETREESKMLAKKETEHRRYSTASTSRTCAVEEEQGRKGKGR